MDVVAEGPHQVVFPHGGTAASLALGHRERGQQVHLDQQPVAGVTRFQPVTPEEQVAAERVDGFLHAAGQLGSG